MKTPVQMLKAQRVTCWQARADHIDLLNQRSAALEAARVASRQNEETIIALDAAIAKLEA